MLWNLAGSSRVNDLKTVDYQGRRLLALFRHTRRSPYHELLDSRYQSVARVRVGNGYRTDAMSSS